MRPHAGQALLTEIITAHHEHVQQQSTAGVSFFLYNYNAMAEGSSRTIIVNVRQVECFTEVLSLKGSIAAAGRFGAVSQLTQAVAK